MVNYREGIFLGDLGYQIYLFITPKVSGIRLGYDKEEQIFFVKASPAVPMDTVMSFVRKQNAFFARHARAWDWVPQFEKGEKHYLLGQYVTLGENGVPPGHTDFRNYQLQMLLPVVKRYLEAYGGKRVPLPGPVKIQFMDSRWGRCIPSRKSFAFNGYLAAYPEKCTECIVVHELCHLVHRNHSNAFYQLMTDMMQDWQKWDRMLSTFEPRPARA